MSESSGCSKLGALALITVGVAIGYAFRNKIAAGFQAIDKKVAEWDEAAKASNLTRVSEDLTASQGELTGAAGESKATMATKVPPEPIS